MSNDLDEFARGVWAAYSSFRLAGFEEDKAFILARDFMREGVRQALAEGKVTA